MRFMGGLGRHAGTHEEIRFSSHSEFEGKYIPINSATFPKILMAGWEYPSGKLDGAESAHTVFLREVCEEFGLTLPVPMSEPFRRFGIKPACGFAFHSSAPPARCAANRRIRC